MLFILSLPLPVSVPAAINPAQSSYQQISLYDMYMLFTRSVQLNMSSARPKPVFLPAIVPPHPPPIADGPPVI